MLIIWFHFFFKSITFIPVATLKTVPMPQGCNSGMKSELFHQELKLYMVNIPGRKSLFHPSQWTSVPDHSPRITQGPASDHLASSWLLRGQHTHSDVSSVPRKFQNYGFGLSIPPDSSVCSLRSEPDHRGTAQTQPHSWSRNVGRWGQMVFVFLKSPCEVS